MSYAFHSPSPFPPGTTVSNFDKKSPLSWSVALCNAHPTGRSTTTSQKAHNTRARLSSFLLMTAASTPNSAEHAESSSSSWSALPDISLRLQNWRSFRAKLVAEETAALADAAAAPLSASRTRRDANINERALRGIELTFVDEDLDNDCSTEKNWAHRLSHVEAGACLLASQKHLWPKAMDYLRHAVVLVTDVDVRTGIQGLLLNRPTGRTVGTSSGVLARVGSEFIGNPVFLGGDSCMGYLEVLHTYGHVPGAREILPGLYRGGFDGCRGIVAEGKADALEIKILLSYMRWTWEQFEEEWNLGAWDVVSVSPNLLKQPQQQPQQLQEPQQAEGGSRGDNERSYLEELVVPTRTSEDARSLWSCIRHVLRGNNGMLPA